MVNDSNSSSSDVYTETSESRSEASERLSYLRVVMGKAKGTKERARWRILRSEWPSKG